MHTVRRVVCNGYQTVSQDLENGVTPSEQLIQSFVSCSQYGLYSAFMGCFVYTIFGSVKDITIGPTALMALMTYQQTADLNPDFAVLLCFFTGVMQSLMGVLHLGELKTKSPADLDFCMFVQQYVIGVQYDKGLAVILCPSGVLIDFISIPVTVGFTSATSVIIACSQVKGLLGLSFKSSGFIDTVKNIGLHVHETQLWDATLGFSCIVVLLLMRVSPQKKTQKGSQRDFWLTGNSGYLCFR